MTKEDQSRAEELHGSLSAKGESSTDRQQENLAENIRLTEIQEQLQKLQELNADDQKWI